MTDATNGSVEPPVPKRMLRTRPESGVRTCCFWATTTATTARRIREGDPGAGLAGDRAAAPPEAAGKAEEAAMPLLPLAEFTAPLILRPTCSVVGARAIVSAWGAAEAAMRPGADGSSGSPATAKTWSQRKAASGRTCSMLLTGVKPMTGIWGVIYVRI